MKYRIGRTEKLNDVIELTDESGNVVKSLEITIDVDIAAKDLTQKYYNFINISRQLKEAQKINDKNEFFKLANLYTLAIDELFEICFGEANRLAIYEFYENNYLEMAQQLVPYIFNRLIPAVNKAVQQKKNNLKKAFKRKL
ncbi:MAG: hypothetical protein ACI4J7_08705 [Ruminiclostridium sp.]